MSLDGKFISTHLKGNGMRKTNVETSPDCRPGPLHLLLSIAGVTSYPGLLRMARFITVSLE